MIGPLLALVCLVASLAGIAAPFVSAVRHGLRGFARTYLGWVGAVLIWGWFVLYVGIQEVRWTPMGVEFWMAGVTALLGTGLILFAWRVALRPRWITGHCRNCGYDLSGLRCCPECGREDVRAE